MESKMVSTTYCGKVLESCKLLVKRLDPLSLPDGVWSLQVANDSDALVDKIVGLEMALEEMGAQHGNISVAYDVDGQVSSGDRLRNSLSEIFTVVKKVIGSMSSDCPSEVYENLEEEFGSALKLASNISESLQLFLDHGEEEYSILGSILEEEASKPAEKRAARLKKKAPFKKKTRPERKYAEAAKEPKQKEPTIAAGLLVGAVIGAILGVVAVVANRNKNKKDGKPVSRKTTYLH